MFEKIIVYNVVGNSFCIKFNDGELISKRIEKSFDESKKIILDFKKTKLITSAFLSAIVGPLYQKYDSNFIEDNLIIVNILPEDKALLERISTSAKLFYINPERFQESIYDILGE